ncbi:MAG: SBBP repeat-containing protein [Caldisericia bacterium]|nr:SBBP repeat-containing protein [Caldisericia bacterium]
MLVFKKLLSSFLVFVLMSVILSLQGFVVLPFSNVNMIYHLEKDSSVKIFTDSQGNNYSICTIVVESPLENKPNSEIYIAKYSKDFSKEIFQKNIGGSGNEYLIDSTILNGKIFICGSTRSPDFPTTKDSLFSTLSGLDDGFFLILNLEGEILYSSLFGGALMDMCTSISPTEKGIINIAGTTWSNDLPVTENAFQKRLYGITDAFCFQYNMNENRLDYSTYIGGSKEEFSGDLCIVGDRAIFYGRTSSYDLPVTENAYNKSFNGGKWDLFIVVLNKDGLPEYSSYFGGSRNDFAKAMAYSKNGRLYLTGRTYSSNFPITPNAFQLSLKGLTDGFIVVFDCNKKTFEYSSFFGGEKTEFPEQIICIDDKPIIVGRTFSNAGFPTTENAINKDFQGGWSDGFILKLNIENCKLDYSSFVGGNDRDSVDDIYWNSKERNLYISGRTMSSSISVNPIEHLITNDSYGSWDGFFMKYLLPVD